MQMPGQNHREPWFPILFKKMLEETKMLFNTSQGTTFIFSGTGTGGWESALTNTLSPGDHVVAFRYGLFSLLWIDMMERLGLKVTVFDERWGNGADEQKLEQVSSTSSSLHFNGASVGAQGRYRKENQSCLCGTQRNHNGCDERYCWMSKGDGCRQSSGNAVGGWGVVDRCTGLSI